MLGVFAGWWRGDQFIRDSLDKPDKISPSKNGREPSPKRSMPTTRPWSTARSASITAKRRQKRPEPAELGLMKSAIGDILNSGGSLPMRIAKTGGKVALSAFGIPTTETLTQQIQQQPALRGKPA